MDDFSSQKSEIAAHPHLGRYKCMTMYIYQLKEKVIILTNKLILKVKAGVVMDQNMTNRNLLNDEIKKKIPRIRIIILSTISRHLPEIHVFIFLLA